MSDKIPFIKDRVLLIPERKGVTKKVFFESIGASYGNFTGSSKKTPLSSTTIGNISAMYPDVNLNWLINGKGQMFNKPNKPIVNNNDNSDNEKMNINKKDLKRKGVPLIPIEAMAGWGNGDVTVMDYDTNEYIIPEFDELKVDFMIRVKGSSMYPKYNSGDMVACKKIPLDTFFQWNKVYVLDTIQGAMIKRIKKSDVSESISCVSDNKSYDPFDLLLDEIYSLAIVVGVIRLE